jgi:hypothetical protein
MSQPVVPGIVLVGALATTGCMGDWDSGPLRRESQSVDLDKAERVAVELALGAGELRVTGGAAKLIEADFEYRNLRWKPEVRYRSGGVRGDLSVKTASWGGNSGAGKWDLRLNNTVPLEVTTNLGAGEARLDFSSLNLLGVDIHMGVGELKLDLRGAPKRSYDVRINGGVGEATVYLPKSVGVVATAQGGIGDISVRGLERRGGYWVNLGHENNPVTIRVDAKGGVGEINLVAE